MDIKKLEKTLRNASLIYYSGAYSIMSDAEFDRQRDELERLDPTNPFLAEIGAPSTSSGEKVLHTIPMGSLKKFTAETALAEFATWRATVSKTARSLECSVQLKLDGSSIEVVYNKGKFVQAITRGNGLKGDDVSHTIRNAQGLPKTISVMSQVSVRCEVMLKIADWKKHFADKANPRNAAAGLVRRSDAKGSEHLTTFAFDVLFDNNGFKTEADRIKWLKAEGFQTTPNRVVKADDVEKFVNGIIAQRSSLPIEIDGAVVKLNQISDQEKLGEHNGFPYWARAWKFKASGGHSTLLGVDWAVGTMGTITPVARIAPVSVGGTTIQNVTLHNVDEIARLGIAIGDEIEVVRAGEVIPKIIRVVSKGKNRKAITIDQCPSCGSKVGRDGPRAVCLNTDCSGSKFKKIQKWVKKREIMFLGDSNLMTLWDANAVRTVVNLYGLTVGSMVAAGVGQGMATKILDQIEKSRTCSLADFMGSLSLDMLGRSEAKNLVGHGIDTLSKWENITAKQIEALPGYQSTKARRISTAVRKNWKLISTLAAELSISTTFTIPASGKLTSMSFCFTGTMENSRKNLETMATDAGGQIRSVSKELSFLVIADASSSSSKAVKARKLGVTFITEDSFLKMV